MKTKLHWTQGLFSEVYCIFDSDKQIGFIRKTFFSQKSIAEIKDEKYVFQERGFFRQEIDIVDTSKNKVIGKIKYNSWKNKTFIGVNNETLTWQLKNFWGTKWLLHNSKGVNVVCRSSSSKGEIETNENDAINLILGLYVYNYYTQILMFCILCMIIIGYSRR